MASDLRHTVISDGLVAGVAGGLAEVGWVTLYGAMSGGDPAVVARGVTTAVGVNALLPDSPVVLGVAVHMTLAAMLGVVLSVLWTALRSLRPSLHSPYPVMLAALAGVWATNFLVVLPLVCPAFAHLVPYAVSLTSKLLFGVAAASVFQAQTALDPVAIRIRIK